MGKFIHAPDEESAPYIDFNDEGGQDQQVRSS